MSAKPTVRLGSLFGAALARAHRGIALGVYGLTRALPPRVALGGHLGQFPRVDDRRVAKLLTWPWWSSSALATALLISISPAVELVVNPQ